MNDIAKRTTSRTPGWSLFDDDFDNLFEGFFRPMRASSQTSSAGNHTPAIDITENAEAYVVKADLPGIKKEDINVTVQNGMLTISAETDTESEEKKGDKVIRKERRYGKYTRSMSLHQNVDESNVKATYTDGVLQLTLPKKEDDKPQKISVDIN